MYGKPMISGLRCAMPLTTKAVTLSFCHVARSSLTTTAIFGSWYMWPANTRAAAAVLYVRDVAAGTAREHVEAWVPRVPGIAEVLHARFLEHRYPPHTHDTWAVIIVDGGEIRYDLARHHRGADRATVTILPPHVTHDGRAATDVGFRNRVVS